MFFQRISMSNETCYTIQSLAVTWFCTSKKKKNKIKGHSFTEELCKWPLEELHLVWGVCSYRGGLVKTAHGLPSESRASCIQLKCCEDNNRLILFLPWSLSVDSNPLSWTLSIQETIRCGDMAVWDSKSRKEVIGSRSVYSFIFISTSLF